MVNIQDIQRLRSETGAGMMDVKKALEVSEGDLEKARRWLREHGLAGFTKLAQRENEQGAVAISTSGDKAAMVSLKCETDFVAKSEEFINVLNDLASRICEKGLGAEKEFEEEINSLRLALKENISLGEIVLFEAQGDSVIGDYLHVQNDRGVNGVLVELEGGTKELAHDIAVHIAFARPKYLNISDIPKEKVEEEQAIIVNALKNEGKPENQIEKITQGRLQGWFKEICLIEQPFVKDEKKRIKDILGEAKVKRFSQIVVGK